MQIYILYEYVTMLTNFRSFLETMERSYVKGGLEV